MSLIPPLVGRVRWPLRWVRVGIDWRVGLEGWLWWSAHPRGGAVCKDHAEYPAFAPGISEVAVGFWPFVSVVYNLPQL